MTGGAGGGVGGSGGGEGGEGAAGGRGEGVCWYTLSHEMLKKARSR